MALWNEFLPSKSVSHGNLEQIFDKFQKEFLGPDFFSGDFDFTVKVEVKESDKEYKVLAEVPGLKKDDIDLTFRDGRLIIQGEKKQESKQEEKDYVRSEFSYGSFHRSVALGADADPEDVSATYKDGLLEVIVKKTEDEGKRSKRIEIKQ